MLMKFTMTYQENVEKYAVFSDIVRKN